MTILNLFEKKCDYCGKKIAGNVVGRFSLNFCSKEHVANYFGADVEETEDKIFWADFY